ncbi:Leucine-rich repeat extensin-like protein 4, partial [Cucurbita argyrosperma subsp. sororia]
MASFPFLSSSLSSKALFLLLLHLSCLFKSLSAKHGGVVTHNDHHHHHHHHRARSPSTNPRLHQAFLALQAWKKVIYSDPKNHTTNWVGPSVCSYFGVYCAPSLNDSNVQVVAGIDLNHGDIAGFLPNELGLLTDLALLHLNSNRFCGVLPQSLANLSLLFELDLSNNRFVGPFPSVVLHLPNLTYLDLRFNEFEGQIPPELFNKSLDAIFINSNRFTNIIPRNIGGKSASVIVFANNNLKGCLPPTIASFANSLEELLLINTSLSGCLPQEIGFLYKLKVLDVSFNELMGPLPYSLAGLGQLEQLNLAHNLFTGNLFEGLCNLPNLENVTVSYNYFCEEEGVCRNLTAEGVAFDDRRNCVPEKPLQRSKKECSAVVERPVDCFEHPCGGGYGSSIAAVPASAPISATSSVVAPAHL